VGGAVASRTYGELAAVTAGIPAELTAALPRRPPVRARRRIPFNTAVTGGACMAGVVNAGMVAVAAGPFLISAISAPSVTKS
jgi:hypothetical protein